MKQLSQTRTTAGESDSRILAVERLTDTQRETMRRAVGDGLWEEILEGRGLPESAFRLVKQKMKCHGILPMRMWWQED